MEKTVINVKQTIIYNIRYELCYVFICYFTNDFMLLLEEFNWSRFTESTQ